MKQPIDWERYNPFRRPDWRMERVASMLHGTTPARSTRRDDEYIRALRAFLLRYRSGTDEDRNQLAYENPGLYWAYQIYDRRHDDGHRKAIIIESRILARQTDDEIAADMGTIPDVIRWYEALFFNVRDRLHCHDWIVDNVLVPAFLASRAHRVEQLLIDTSSMAGTAPRPTRNVVDPFFDASLKFFAYYGGKHVLNFVLSGFLRDNLCEQPRDVGKWLDAAVARRLKQMSAAAATSMEINKFNLMQLFELHRELLRLERTTAASMQESEVQQAVAGLLNEMRWATGRKGEEAAGSDKLRRADTLAAELRDHELHLLTDDTAADTIREVETLKLPQPAAAGRQEDVADANAQQGR